MIINNNNNNNSGCSNGYQMNFEDNNGIPNGSSSNNKCEFSKRKLAHDRSTMILLSKYFGWIGWHYYYFKKPLLAVLHTILGVAGLIGAASMLYIVLYVDRPETLFRIATGMLTVGLLSVLSGVICSVYWSFHNDNDFEKAYPNPNEDANKEVEKQ